MTDLRKTALFETHTSLKARMVPFGGWNMPVEYSGIIPEHNAVRTGVGLFDVSHMGEFIVSGPEALNLIQFVTCNDASRLVDGQAQYSALTTEEGTVVDDLLVYRESASRYMLVVNAANIETDLQWIQSHNTFIARIENISTATGLLALQGPYALETLQVLVDIPLNSIAPFHFARTHVSGVDTMISRTGYTGEDGFELYFAAYNSETLWKSLLSAGKVHGILPSGLGARNTLRLEAGLLLYGNDIDRTTTLLEAGLGWIVKLGKGRFVGSEALAKEKAEGPKKKLVGLEMLGPEIAREHYPVKVDEQEVGHVTSGSPSITLKKNIGLTYLPVDLAAVGETCDVLVRKRACKAQIVSIPFYKRSRE
ncbi:MAG TPA: glycine cleavage system aminomethyltransferase GcvT [Terriglobia bacterium]|nr:glycine cleavage system aminomethyltransferase GcvT [Terriglobia bacterium]